MENDKTAVSTLAGEDSLVWQEETKKLRSILAVPRADGKGEVLLVGGMDGITEYSFNK